MANGDLTVGASVLTQQRYTPGRMGDAWRELL